MDATVTLGYLHSSLSFLYPFLVRSVGIGLAVLDGSIVVFADGIKLVAFLHGHIGPTTAKQQGRDDAEYENEYLSHTL